MEKILYNDIHLPDKVSDILELDFWALQHVGAAMVRTVTNPVKFSAYTSIFVTRGTAEADINLIAHRLEAPCVVNVSAGDIVHPRIISDDFDASVAVFSQRLTDGMVTLLKDAAIFSIIGLNPILQLSSEDSQDLQRFYEEIMAIAKDSSMPYPFETVLYTLVSYFFKNFSKYYEQFRQSLAPSVHNRIADRFIRLVQEHFRRERFLDFYAGKLDITPKHLSRTIKIQTGASAVDWINRYVILEAKVMLRSSNLNVQQIAEALNFPSQSFFGKYFKKATGVSPKDYRNSFS